MKELSNLTELIRTILYDIVGLLIPGLLFLCVLLVLGAYWTGPSSPFRLIKPNQPTPTLWAVLLAGYVLGYLIESLWMLHSSFLIGFGRRLLRKQGPERWPRVTGEANVATQLAREGFEPTESFQRPFYTHVRQIIGNRARFPHPEKLQFTDVSALAHAFAGGQADLARQFRYRGDLCGTMSTLSLLIAVAMIPVLVLKNDYPSQSLLVVAVLLLWIFVLALPLSLKFKWKGRAWAITPWLRRVAMPLILLVVMMFLPATTKSGWHVGWAFPALVVVWFVMLWRAYFYLNLGGRVHFGVALAAVVDESPQGTSSDNRDNLQSQ